MLDNEFPPLGGGTGVVNFHLLEEMANYPDVWVDLVTSSRTRRMYETESFAERITIHKVPVDNCNIHHATNVELLRYAWRGLRRARQLLRERQYDLSFAFSGVPAGAISYALRRAHKLPYLVSLQGPDVPGFEARYNYLYPPLKPVLRRIWRDASIVTAISKEHERLARQFMPGKDIVVVHNGVDTAAFQPAAAPRSHPEMNIVCVGRLIERKGQHHLLRAFAQLRGSVDIPLRLTLVGTGDAEASLRRLAAELGVMDHVAFTGFVSREGMPAVYHDADVFVLPSQSEGMSIALLEGMASGLPVVVTNTGGVDELVREGVNGHIVSWADVPALAKALERIVQDPAGRLRMGAESRRVAARFGWPEITRTYLGLCEGIAAQKTDP